MQRHKLAFSLLIFSLLPLSLLARPYVLVLSQEDLKEIPSSPATTDVDPTECATRVGRVGDSDSKPEHELDPGSWRPIFEPDAATNSASNLDPEMEQYYSAVEKMFSAVTNGEVRVVEEAVAEIEELATVKGNSHARSVLGFLYGLGQIKERDTKLLQQASKSALAYTYYRQQMYEKAIILYAELAEVAVNNFLISKDSPVIVRLGYIMGAEENKDVLRKSRGEDDDVFQILEYQAQKGNAGAMFKIGYFYYFGLRGLRRDHAKALAWFSKAAEKGEPRSMELLGEIFARGAGVERNYTKALEWLTLAAKLQLYSAYNGMGYLYVKGYGVQKKNYSKAKEYFERAADNEDAGGHYNLGVMHLKGIGVKRDVRMACQYFIVAANAGQPKAFYQLAKMFHMGVGLRKNLAVATALYKLVAEQGPWNSLSRWALESYLKGGCGQGWRIPVYSSELGYEIAQSNAAWILDKYAERSMCMGESGFCTDLERHQRAHSLWWQASEQGNEHAALLIGDAYYYGRGTERDYERAAEAYMHAKSQSNAQAMFNLGYMHEHGQGLPVDLHLAKRYYDQALEIDAAAKLPVTLSLSSLWIRKNYADSFMVHVIDSLPEVYPKIEGWVENVILEDGNAMILALFVCLLTVLYFREQQRRNVVVPPAAAGEVGIRDHNMAHAPPALN
uniref:DOD-type homing endonuclease domain-containing protein n=1 Tax=Salix viminalis TaxID=40686 RepID=A0A6N2KAE3_SALVM